MTRTSPLTFADRLTLRGVTFPADTVIFESTDVLGWVEGCMKSERTDAILDVLSAKRTMPVYPHCFIEARADEAYAGVFLQEVPVETLRSNMDMRDFAPLTFDDQMKYDDVLSLTSRAASYDERAKLFDLVKDAYKFFLILPICDFGGGEIHPSASVMGAVFDGYGMLLSMVLDLQMLSAGEFYAPLGLQVTGTIPIPRSALYMTLCAMAHVHHRGEVELIEHPRHVARQSQRANGKAPSPYFRLIRPDHPRKVYASDGHNGRHVREHWVSGHFRTVVNHPLEWLNGTRFIKTHTRGRKGAACEHAPRYQIRLDK